MTLQPISRCLNPKLIEICQRAIKLEGLSGLLETYLPQPVPKHCRVGSFNNGCLTLVAQDAAWASQLRFLLPDLRDQLRQKAGLYQLASLKVTVSELAIPSTKAFTIKGP